MSIPVISIIIPTYNSEKSLSECLRSIVNQYFKNIEIIIIDGASSDETITIIRQYEASYPSIRWISTKDKGIYDAMNKGINMAKGEWLYFFGSDDTLHNNKVFGEVLRPPLGNNVNVIYGNVKIVGNTSWASDGEIYDGIFDLRKLLKKNICHQAIFYKRAFVLKKIGYFNLRYKLCADWDFNLRCWSKSTFVYKDIIIANFNCGGASTIHSMDHLLGEDFLNNLIDYFNLSIFNSLLSDKDFPYFNEVLQLRQKAGLGAKLFYYCKKKAQSILVK